MPAEPKIPDGTRLGQALKLSDVVSTGGEAKMAVQFGDVTVNGEVETRRGRTLRTGDVIEVYGERLEVG